MKRAALWTVSLVALAGLVSCGGGGGGGGGDTIAVQPATLPAAGLYGGALTGGSGSSEFQLLILDGGEFWAFFGASNPPTFEADNFAQGKWISNGPLLTTADARYYSTSMATVAVSRVSYNANTSIEGSVTAPGIPTLIFDGAPLASSAYNYESSASLPQVEGLWTVKGLRNETYCLDVDANGDFSATPTDAQGCSAVPLVSVPGCSFTGKFLPRPSGKNVFNVEVVNGGAPCTAPTLPSNGVAYLVSAGVETQLALATVSADRSLAAVVTGVR